VPHVNVPCGYTPAPHRPRRHRPAPPPLRACAGVAARGASPRAARLLSRPALGVASPVAPRLYRRTIRGRGPLFLFFLVLFRGGLRRLRRHGNDAPPRNDGQQLKGPAHVGGISPPRTPRGDACAGYVMPRRAVRGADRAAVGGGATDRRAPTAVGLPRLGRLAWRWGGGGRRRGRLVHHVGGWLHHRRGHAVGRGRVVRPGRAERHVHGRAAATPYRPRDAEAVDGGATAPPVVAVAAVSPVTTLCAAAAVAATAHGARLVDRTSSPRECRLRHGVRPRGDGWGQHSRVLGRDRTAPSMDGHHAAVWRVPNARGGGGAARIIPPPVTAAGPTGAPVADAVAR